MPISTPREPRFAIVVTQDTPKGANASLPTLAGRFRAGEKITDNANFDTHVRVLGGQRNSDRVRELAVLPTPQAAGNGQLLSRTGSIRRRFRADLDGGVLYDQMEVASTTGVIATDVGRGIWDFAIDPAFGAATPSTEVLFASVTMRAPLRNDPTQFLTWPALTIETRGGAVVVVQGPRVVGQPGPRAFVEGQITEFVENLASFFAGGVAPFTYQVLNADGSPLTDFVLDEIEIVSPTEVYAYITSPACQGDVGSYPIRYQVTDPNGLTASVIQLNTVTADPPIQVLSNPAPRSVPINQSGTIAFRISDYFLDNSPLTVTMDAGDMVALPAGYSFSVSADTLTLSYPTEDSATTRNLRIVATEQSGFARNAAVPFVFTRPAAAAIIGSAAPVTVPENAVTRFIVNVANFIGGASVYGVRGRGNTALPTPFTVVSNVAGLLTIDANIANNQVQVFLIEYFGDAVVVPSEWISEHNAPVAGVINISQVNILPVTIDVVAASDDPLVNVIVPGSVSITEGVAEIVGGRIVVTPDSAYVGAATLFYTLAAGNEETEATATITFTPFQPPVPGAPLFLTATVGQTFAPVSLADSFLRGTFPIAIPSIEFATSSGAPIGKSVTIADIGTFVINNAGVMTLSARGTRLANVPLYVTATDTEGNRVEDDAPLLVSFTQIADPGAPPPSGVIEPNVDDGKPILQLGVQGVQDFTGERIWASRHQKLFRHVSSFEMNDVILSGKFDPETGWWTLAPGEVLTFRFIRPDQDRGRTPHPEIDSGQWVIKYTLDPLVSPNTAALQVTGYTLTESGSVGDQKRFTFNTVDDDFNRNVTLRGLVSGGKIRVDYIGPAVRENIGNYDPDTLGYLYDYKIIRYMNWGAPATSKICRDSDWLPDNWYWEGQTFSGLPTTVPTVNRNKLKAGHKYKTIFDLSVLSQTAAWINLPYTLGAAVIEPQVWFANSSSGLYGNSYLGPIVEANFASIDAAIPGEYFAHGVRVGNSLNATDYPVYRVIIVEIGNEMWNSGAAGVGGYRYCQALGRAISGVNAERANVNTGMGYLNARALRAFFAGVRSVRPAQELVGCMTFSRNQGTGNAQDAITGFNAEAARAPGILLLDVYLGITNYYSGANKWQNARSPQTGNPFYGDATSAATFQALWAAAHSADEAAFFQKIENWYLDPASERNNNGWTDSIYGARGAFIEWRDFAVAQGARGILPYEGGNHDNGDSAAGVQTAYPPSVQAVDRFIRSPHAERITRKMIELLLPINPTNPVVTTGWRPQSMPVSNYLDIGPDNPTGSISGPWRDRVVGTLRGPYVGQAEGWRTYFRSNGSAAVPPPPPPPTPGGGPSGGTPLFSRTIVSTDTIAGLQAEGWGPGSINHIVAQGATGEYALRANNESAAMFRTFRQSLQANPNLTFRVRWQPDNGVRGEYLRFERGTNQVSVRAVIDSISDLPTGELTVSFFGQPDIAALITSGANLFAGGFVDMEVDYFLATNGLVRVRINNTLVGQFTGNTNPLAVQNPYIDRIRIRGRSYFSQFEDKTA